MPKGTSNFSIQAKVTNKTDGELLIYGDISDIKWYEEDVTPKEVDAELKKLGDIKNLTVRINSYGGSVFAGIAIISMLNAKKAKGCKVITVVEGIAASMGSAIAVAGDEIIMNENSQMMIHKPSTMTWGNANDLEKSIGVLNRCEQSICNVYMKHFTGTEEELKALLTAETWLNANEALAYGLCTKVEGEVQIAASANGFIFNRTEIPIEVLDKIKSKIKINKESEGEDMFNKEQQEKIQAIIDSGKPVMFTKDDKGEFVIGEFVAENTITEFLTADAVKAKAGKDVTADELLKMFDTVSEQATKIANFDGEKALLLDKATAYDTIKNKAIADALTLGVKAKADKFVKDRWEKTFDSFSLEEIQAQGKEWQDEASMRLNAGKHLSNQNNQSQTEEKEFNEKDFQI